MSIKIDGEKLAKKVKNNYELVIAISKRARQLQRGNSAMIKAKSLSSVTVASLEFKENKYNVISQDK